ncbi:MAG: hypothetical protein ACTSYX_04870 [Candidatus Thorarchaeota archaeon]
MSPFFHSLEEYEEHLSQEWEEIVWCIGCGARIVRRGRQIRGGVILRPSWDGRQLFGARIRCEYCGTEFIATSALERRVGLQEEGVLEEAMDRCMNPQKTLEDFLEARE